MLTSYIVTHPNNYIKTRVVKGNYKIELKESCYLHQRHVQLNWLLEIYTIKDYKGLYEIIIILKLEYP